ncbi:hypothetical protein NYE70_07240 [Paenibacillus sp. FSL R5-0407]|uniref:hypothetical protein n=1 Tax=Paenibacillus sp. FSL R5-0407 TaxID=2975320 RepID=UPI0030F632BC
MKSSSFLCGVLFGAVAAVWASRRKGGLMSMINGAGSVLKTHETNSNSSQPKTSQAATGQDKIGAAATAQVHPSPVSSTHENHSKEYNLKQITDFIKGNPDVRREVDAILKETHSTIPGL